MPGDYLLCLQIQGRTNTEGGTDRQGNHHERLLPASAQDLRSASQASDHLPHVPRDIQAGEGELHTDFRSQKGLLGILDDKAEREEMVKKEIRAQNYFCSASPGAGRAAFHTKRLAALVCRKGRVTVPLDGRGVKPIVHGTVSTVRDTEEAPAGVYFSVAMEAGILNMYWGEGMKEQINSFSGSSVAPFRMTYPSYLYKDEFLLLFFQLTKKKNPI